MPTVAAPTPAIDGPRIRSIGDAGEGIRANGVTMVPAPIKPLPNRWKICPLDGISGIVSWRSVGGWSLASETYSQLLSNNNAIDNRG